MPRKAIFLGLMIALGAVLAYLIMESRERETQALTLPAEIVKESRTNPIRVLTPVDLTVIKSSVDLRPSENGDGEPKPTIDAVHRIVAQNSGAVPYRAVMLELDYLGGGGRSLETRKRLVEETLPPNATISFQEFGESNVPARAQKCEVRILYAELGQREAFGSQSTR